MRTFHLTVRTAAGDKPYTWLAASSAEAAEQVAGLFDEPCGITVHKEPR
jgi:hypothetical protein